MSTAQVQRWVLTVLDIAIVGHLAEALTIFAVITPEEHPSSRIGLLVIAGVVGLITVAVARTIHGRRLLSPWMVAGLLPALTGAYLAFWR